MFSFVKGSDVVKTFIYNIWRENLVRISLNINVTGLYCKWHIKGNDGERLAMRFLDFDVHHNSPDCDMDGSVVYLGTDIYGDKFGELSIDNYLAHT